MTNCLNLGSYNYLGFAENSGVCADAAKEATYKYGAAVCSTRRDFGKKSVQCIDQYNYYYYKCMLKQCSLLAAFRYVIRMH